MTTTTLTLAAFLEARLSDIETIAREALDAAPHWSLVANAAAGQADAAAGWHVLRNNPARVLTEVAAKRRLVELWSQWDALCSPDDWPEGDMGGAALADAGRWMLRVAAAVYSDHADYDPSWAVT